MRFFPYSSYRCECGLKFGYLKSAYAQLHSERASTLCAIAGRPPHDALNRQRLHLLVLDADFRPSPIEDDTINNEGFEYNVDVQM